MTICRYEKIATSRSSTFTLTKFSFFFSFFFNEGYNDKTTRSMSWMIGLCYREMILWLLHSSFPFLDADANHVPVTLHPNTRTTPQTTLIPFVCGIYVPVWDGSTCSTTCTWLQCRVIRARRGCSNSVCSSVTILGILYLQLILGKVEKMN